MHKDVRFLVIAEKVADYSGRVVEGPPVGPPVGHCRDLKGAQEVAEERAKEYGGTFYIAQLVGKAETKTTIEVQILMDTFDVVAED
jgi:hypothetical protein